MENCIDTICTIVIATSLAILACITLFVVTTSIIASIRARKAKKLLSKSLDRLIETIESRMKDCEHGCKDCKHGCQNDNQKRGA